MVRWLKKSLNETCLTWSHMHEKSRWLNFKMAQNLKITCFYWDDSLFWAISLFMIEKMNHLSKKTRDRDFEPFWNWAISISHAYDFTRNMSRSMTFWAISPYPLYRVLFMSKSRLRFILKKTNSIRFWLGSNSKWITVACTDLSFTERCNHCQYCPFDRIGSHWAD